MSHLKMNTDYKAQQELGLWYSYSLHGLQRGVPQAEEIRVLKMKAELDATKNLGTIDEKRVQILGDSLYPHSKDPYEPKIRKRRMSPGTREHWDEMRLGDERYAADSIRKEREERERRINAPFAYQVDGMRAAASEFQRARQHEERGVKEEERPSKRDKQEEEAIVKQEERVTIKQEQHD